MPKRAGRKSLAQTPAPKSERIKGSKVNPKGSARSESSAKQIKLSEQIMSTLRDKLAEFKKENPNKNGITLNDLKAVFRRGAGAYSKSHRPTISGGAPNSRNAWAFARVNAFLRKAGGGEAKKAYVQDDDLMAEGGGLTDAIDEAKENLLLNGIVLQDENKNITVISYNTGMHRRKLSLYNQFLIYKTLKEINEDYANEIIINLTNDNYVPFEYSELDKYKDSNYLIICNQNEVLYNHSNQYAKGGEIDEKTLQKRWTKKRQSLVNMAEKVQSLRSQLRKDLKSEDEKDRLTALAISIMDKTAERVGNNESASNGHFGITGLKKKHVSVSGDTVTLKYTGKSGVKQDKSFTDSVIASTLKESIANSPNGSVFTTGDGFSIKEDRVNRYLSKYDISAKDLRGYSANKWIVDKLNRIPKGNIPDKETERKRLFNSIVKSVAEKVGHGSATLKKHYMLPSVERNFVKNGKVSDLSDVKRTYYNGGALNMANGGEASFDKIISASSRFRPKETIVFDPPLIGKNGAKLISYVWTYTYEMVFSQSAQELVNKRISDWTQAEISADTGRDIVHQYTILFPDGEIRIVSSDSVPILLGYIDRKQLKSFPNLVTASKTLAKQKLQLSIIEAKIQQKEDAIKLIIERGYPELIVETGGLFGYVYKMGDVSCNGTNPNDPERIECVKDAYVTEELKKLGINPYENLSTYDLKNRITRQERKIQQILEKDKTENYDGGILTMAEGGETDKAKYRILKADGKIKYAGTEMPSWMTLQRAKELVEYSKGEMIYQYENGEKLWEVFAEGGDLSDEDKKETYAKWKTLVNMSKGELQKFYDSEEGKVAGLSASEAKAQGIDSGRESARWIMKMKDTPIKEWTPTMWRWAKKQISFVSRMSGNKGQLYDDKGRKTRKHLSLLIWGNNPEKKSSGGNLNLKITNTMAHNHYHSLPSISSLEKGKKIYLKDDVFTGNIDSPVYVGERYIKATIMGDGKMLNSLKLKVLSSSGANPLSVGQLIERPIRNITLNGRDVEESTTTKKASKGLETINKGDILEFNGLELEVEGLSPCMKNLKCKDLGKGVEVEYDLDEILDNATLKSRKDGK